MSLIKCPECGNEISDKAYSCPKCGCPIKQEKVIVVKKDYKGKAKAFTIAGIIVFIISAIVAISTYEERLSLSAAYAYMTDETASYLKSIKKRQRENQLRLGEEYVYTDYVCVDEYGQQIKPSYISQTFGKILKKNGLRHIRFHDLRHTCASLLLNQGYELTDVSSMLGHSTITTTADIYGHTDEKRMRDIAEKMGSVLAI